MYKYSWLLCRLVDSRLVKIAIQNDLSNFFQVNRIHLHFPKSLNFAELIILPLICKFTEESKFSIRDSNCAYIHRMQTVST